MNGANQSRLSIILIIYCRLHFSQLSIKDINRFDKSEVLQITDDIGTNFPSLLFSTSYKIKHLLTIVEL